MIRESLKKMLICILVFILLFNFLIASVSFADTEGNVVTSTSVEEHEAKQNNRVEEAGSGLSGILLMVIRLIMYIPAMIVNLETYAVAISAGKADTDPLSIFITPFDIIFNRFTLTDINIFSLDGLDDPNGLVGTIRQSIAMWFRIATGIAIGFLVIIFFIILIRLALNGDVAERKAKMKTALMDWLVSVLLVILMDFFVIGMININSMFVASIKGAASTDIAPAVTAIQDVILSDKTGFLLGFGALFTYFALTIATIWFLIRYIFRFFKVVLLVIIAPLAPIPYAVNKMTDKKSGSSLQVWLQEFIDAVFTQLIHCVVYVCVVGVALKGFAANTEIKGLEALAPCVFAIFAMFFVIPAENLVRRIFGIKRTGGVTNIIRNVASGAREVSTAVATIQSGTSIIGGLMNPAVGGANQGTDTLGIDTGGNVHTKPIDAGANSGLLGAGTPGYSNGNNLGLGDGSGIDGVQTGEGTDSTLLGEDGGITPGIGVGDRETAGKLEDLMQTVIGLTAGKGNGENVVDADVVDADTIETVNTDTVDVNESETSETSETYEEVPVIIPPEGSNDEEIRKLNQMLLTIQEDLNGKIEELKKELGEKLEEVLSPEKMKEIQTEIITLIKEKLEGIENPSEDELAQIKEEVMAEVSSHIQSGDEEVDKKLANVFDSFTSMAMAMTQSGLDIEISGQTNDVQGGEVDISTDAVEGVVDETTEYIQDAISTELALVPATRDAAVDVATKNAIFKGEIDGEIDMSDVGLSEIVSRLATSSTAEYGDNFDKALREAQRLVEKEGEAALANVDAFNNAPSMEAYSKLSDAGQTMVRLENMAAARGIAVNATVNSTTATKYSQAEMTSVTHTAGTTGSDDVVAKLKAQKGGNNNT